MPLFQRVHAGVICDGCRKSPITGNRHICLLCDNYDLCENCVKRNIHDNHVFYKIQDPSNNLWQVEYILLKEKIAQEIRRHEEQEEQEQLRQAIMALNLLFEVGNIIASATQESGNATASARLINSSGNVEAKVSTWRRLFNTEEPPKSSNRNSVDNLRIDAEFKCSICANVMDNPRSLPCGHTFCAVCIAKCAGNENDYSAAKLLLENRIRCPVCRQIMSIPKDGLPKNYALANLIEKVRQTVPVEKIAAPKNEKCSDCKSTLLIEKLHICGTCEGIVLCSDCVIKKHRSHDTSAYIVKINARKNFIELQQLKTSMELKQREIEKADRDLKKFTEYCEEFSRNFSDTAAEFYSKFSTLQKKLSAAKSDTEVEKLLEEAKRLEVDENELLIKFTFHTGKWAIQKMKFLFGENASKNMAESFLNKIN